MQANAAREDSAIIVGGGIGGLCAAIALRAADIDTVVYERVANPGDVGAGLIVAANAMRSLRRLNLADAVIRQGSIVQQIQIRKADGKLLSSTDASTFKEQYGEPSVAIHRAALHRILLEALPPSSVKLGCSCASIEQSEGEVVAHFVGGEQARAKMLIGADGIRSMVRQHLFPETRLRYSGYSAWRGVVQARHETTGVACSESWGRGRRFGIIPLDSKRIYWFATGNAPAGREDAAAKQKETLLQMFGDWHKPIAELIADTPAEAILHNDIYDFAPMRRWRQGRITLLGDAAHATTPNLGQGACMAIESADALAQSISGNEALSQSFENYEARRRPRTAFITNQSWRLGRMAQMENAVACAVRNLMVRLTPAAAMQRQLAKVLGDDS
ncbi:MAG: FAD-dependent monooxygenase [Leptospirales bacterium]|nr:FAD-dependent monooxygenase [Leptospirales bacterium]